MTTQVLIMKNIPGAPIKEYGEPASMVIKLENGDRLVGEATVKMAEAQIAYAMERWGFDIRAEVMAALNKHLAPASAQCRGSRTSRNPSLAA